MLPLRFVYLSEISSNNPESKYKLNSSGLEAVELILIHFYSQILILRY